MDIVLAAAFGDQAHLVQKKESFLLREQEFGDWNTLTEAEMEKENPRRFIALKQAKDVYNKFYFRCPDSFLRCTFAAFARARAPLTPPPAAPLTLRQIPQRRKPR
jgi:hypothetical protein